MCGRFTLKESTKVKEKFDINITPSYNISPGTKLLTLYNNSLDFLNWGYSPSWAKKPFNLINARIETIDEKPSFKNAKRCLIIADGYFEWKKSARKIPYYFHMNNELFFFAGLFNNTSGCCIVTHNADQSLTNIHERQPLIILGNDSKKWLDKTFNFNYRKKIDLDYYEVSTKVNSPKNNTKENINPLEIA